MPLFVDYQNDQTFEIDIKPSMYFRFMNENDKNEMRQMLREHSKRSLIQRKYEDALDKLASNYFSLTNEEIEIIQKISSKFI